MEKKKSNYAIGRQFEYKTMKALRQMGAVHIVRSASSKGIFDLVAFFPDGDVWCVQCKKNGRLSARERAVMQEFMDDTNNLIKVLHAYNEPGGGVKWEGLNRGTKGRKTKASGGDV